MKLAFINFLRERNGLEAWTQEQFSRYTKRYPETDTAVQKDFGISEQIYKVYQEEYNSLKKKGTEPYSPGRHQSIGIWLKVANLYAQHKRVFQAFSIISLLVIVLVIYSRYLDFGTSKPVPESIVAGPTKPADSDAVVEEIAIPARIKEEWVKNPDNMPDSIFNNFVDKHQDLSSFIDPGVFKSKRTQLFIDVYLKTKYGEFGKMSLEERKDSLKTFWKEANPAIIENLIRPGSDWVKSYIGK
jgi:hypothetical protein